VINCFLLLLKKFLVVTMTL